jgi:antitoxin ParD1/3/4
MPRLLEQAIAKVSTLPDDTQEPYAVSREESADERLAVIRAGIRASLDDPRPNLSVEEVDAHITTLVAKAEQNERDAAAKG